ncbi:SusC/RagA family TonB-linked outer membrane protein [Flavobacterium hungaricum]|uniref:SusC/RagA family TonB-linked outer membrane protein n=1 Tax=Flavobacterium hungaricum TaxID=2082725 RepID=A0ABR9TDL8_9FLAO|nr:SusC/RagA family TonB-linked outer membrane protein [Flavobacterium hungaricum]MBE8723451.1 SusC/RagA family TonB-linked outer membrane protein [Flavobacterium hungaricum]
MNYFSFYKDGKALYCLFFLGIMLSFSSLYANISFRQNSNPQLQIKGVVTNGSDPLPGVTISVKNKPVIAVSDYSGQYTITAATDDELIVSYIGFKTAVIAVAGRTVVDIRLEYDTTALQEVKVNAGYYSVKESERTGSIARITSKDIENQPVSNILASMQGRMAGVSITQTTGVPGGGFDIKIRGQNSLRTDGNSPLYIIDGVPFSSESIGASQTGTSFPGLTSPLNSINPDSVESIEILKDADATSIYGSRGANGVVLITTKKGKAGRTRYSINASSGTGRVTKFLNLMDTTEYLKMRRQAFANDNITTYGPLDYDVNGTWDQNRSTDWQKELLGGTAQLTDINTSISGGSVNTQFSINGSYNSQSTVFPGDFTYSKAGAHVSLNHQSEDSKFRLSFSVGYNIQRNNQPSYDFTYDARSLPPNAPSLFTADGRLNWENGTWDNPLRNLNTEFKSHTNDLTANTVFSYDIAKELSAKINIGYTSLQNDESRIVPSTIQNPAYNITSASSSIFLNDIQRFSWIAEPQLNWKKSTQYGAFDMLLGATFQNRESSRMVQSGTGFTSNNLIYNLLSAKTVRVLGNDETQYKYQAFFGRLNYNLHQRYILNLTARRDGSSRFGPGNQFAFFGAVGAAWLFYKEQFIKDNSWLNFGKIRASYGTTGSDQIGDYQFLDTYTANSVLYSGITGLAPSRLYNAGFGWETNRKLEVAMELGFLQDRIFFTTAWYRNRSSNQLVGIPLPSTTGFTSIQANLGAVVENSGLEFTLRTVNFTQGSFSWTTSLNLTSPRTKLVDFPNLQSSSYRNQYRIGSPLNIQLLYNFKGVNPQTGLYEYQDINNDGIISFPEDKQIVRDLSPKYYGGIQNQLIYKRISLDFLFQFTKQLNKSYPMGPAGLMSNQQQRIKNSWSQPGDQAIYQIYTTGYDKAAVTADALYNESTAFVTDASFIRLKNICLSYDVPLNLRDTQLKIVLQGQNLLTFTKYRDGDPEFISYGFLPPLKIITAGIQLNF